MPRSRSIDTGGRARGKSLPTATEGQPPKVPANIEKRPLSLVPEMKPIREADVEYQRRLGMLDG